MSEIKITADGSHTLYVKDLDEHYHSIHGAIAESKHIFIDAGLLFLKKNDIRIIEMGFGTGLNAFMTLMEAEQTGINVFYTGIEKYPVSTDLTSQLNYADFFPEEYMEDYLKINDSPWNDTITIRNNFQLRKIEADIRDYQIDEFVDLVYYDAFAPDKQPELWTDEIFQRFFQAMNPGGILTTYAAKGKVRRSMIGAGFHVERIPGPPGKREMLRAIKNL
jgi:tRNA U34 5-methylaminomethyl-2-thiouridine-forming methyltransferase MnmC